MTRKCGDELYRSPSTMSSGHISSLPEGQSAVGVPDLQRLGREAGFYPVPRKKEAAKGDKPAEPSKHKKSSDELGASGETAKAEAHASPSKSKERQGPVDRALQMLKPQKSKQRGERQK